MRVLHVIPSLSAVHGGPSRALPLMERSLVAEGVAIETATTNDEGPGRHNGKSCGRPLFENGVTRHYFHKQVDFYKVSLDLAGWVKCHAQDYDLIHIHALFSFSSIAAAWAARHASVPYIIRPLGTLTQYGRTQRRPWLKNLSIKCLEGPLLRDAAAVHFTSLNEQCEAEECGVPMRSVVIPLGIEAPAIIDDVLVRSRFVALQAAPYLLFLSRLDPKKNLEGLLRAFAQCHVQWPSTQLLIAGTGTRDYVASLVALASNLGLANRVVWAGHIDGDLKASALAGAQFFLLPSFSENFGIAAAEALMAGLPCLLGQGVAIANDVVQAGAGVAVDAEPNAIAAGLRQLLTVDASTYARMSANAEALAKSKFSIEAMGRNLAFLYQSIATNLPILARIDEI